jgi:hypothetical protein
MSATVADGTVYSGQFFQVTQDTTVDGVAPLWDGWHSGWGGAAYWDAGPSTDFIRHYSGRSGQCQLPDGKTVDAIFPAA